jgi:hypothetical protein
MGGTSLATPQDIQSAIYGNPATMSQYHGNHFSFAGGMFRASEDFVNGAVNTSLQSYWAGAGLTWHYDPCCRG